MSHTALYIATLHVKFNLTNQFIRLLDAFIDSGGMKSELEAEESKLKRHLILLSSRNVDYKTSGRRSVFLLIMRFKLPLATGFFFIKVIHLSVNTSFYKINKNLFRLIIG